MNEYAALRNLEKDYNYKVLEALWQHQLSKIDESLDRAGQRGGDSAMRYWAGQRKGFILAITQLQRSLAEMEQKAQEEEDQQDNSVDDYKEIIAGIPTTRR